MAEMVELGGGITLGFKKKKITPRHLNLAVRNDAELDKLLEDCHFPEAGVVLNIHPSLLSKPKVGRKKKDKGKEKEKEKEKEKARDDEWDDED